MEAGLVISSGKGWAAFRLRGERENQQDVHRILTPWGPEGGTLIFVADGHGRHGREAAQLVRKKLPSYLRRAGFAAGKEKQAVIAACLKLDREIKLNYDGGTTLTMAYVSPRYSFMAWVGDSPGYLALKDGFVMLTHPHGLERLDEVARLQRTGASFRMRGGVPVRVLPLDPSVGGINVTRTLGDPAYDWEMGPSLNKRERLIPLPEFADDQDAFARAHWVMLSSDGMPRALDEACVPTSSFAFICTEPTLPAKEAASRFRRLLIGAAPADNIVTTIARPRAQLVVSP